MRNTANGSAYKRTKRSDFSCYEPAICGQCPQPAERSAWTSFENQRSTVSMPAKGFKTNDKPCAFACFSLFFWRFLARFKESAREVFGSGGDLVCWAGQQVSKSASQQLGESASRRVSESASQQASESASQRVSESAGQRVSGSADWDEDAFGRKRRYGEFGAYLFGLCG